MVHLFVRYRLFFCFCAFFFSSFVRESKYFTRSACGGVHTDVCESDSKASVSSHVHYTHSLWQQKGEKTGLAVAHTAGGLSRGCLWNTHGPKNTHTHIWNPAASQPVLLWWCKGGVAAWGGTVRVRDRRAKGDDSLVLTDNFHALFFHFLFPSAFNFLEPNYFHLLFLSSLSAHD